MDSLTTRFMSLFRGNARSYGRWDAKTGRVVTIEGAYEAKQFEDHLNGFGSGVGVVPILDDGTCYFGVIDIDNHGSDQDIDLVKLVANVKLHSLPLIVCRSKSGGAHCYLFGAERMPAARVREVLKRWADKIGAYEMATNRIVDIFPKQDRLDMDDHGNRALGNWINLPYYDHEHTNRYAVEQAGKLTLDLFVTLAESSKTTVNGLERLRSGDHSEAPPCVQRMLSEGVPEGHRNMALHTIGLYFKKKNPDTFRDAVYDVNSNNMMNPLPHAEVRKVVGSLTKRDYRYKCGEEPMHSFCDRGLCVKRQFGISKNELEELDSEDMLPEFSGLVQYTTQPVRWSVSVDGTKIDNVGTEDLYNYRRMQILIAENMRKVAPPISAKRWTKILSDLMAECQIEEAPEDASVGGIIAAKLREFINRVDLSDREPDPSDRNGLLMGMPVLTQVDGYRAVLFRGSDFVAYLKRTRSEELKGPNLWFVLKNDLNLKDVRVRAGKSITRAWVIPVSEDDEILFKDVAVGPEF
jgi:hypothetical protein